MFSFYFLNVAYGKFEIRCMICIISLLDSAALTTILASSSAFRPPVRPAYGPAGVLSCLELPLPLPSIPRTRSQPLPDF